MAKRKSWFGWVKRLFTCESKDKKPKKWGWSLGRLKQKQYPTITAPSRTLIEANAEQRKHALTVAIATAAAAEAAVAAAHAAAEVLKLTGGSRSYSYMCKGDRTLAAIKIQSAYRAHLARKALGALKGVIRLQAIIRGQVVRRKVSSTLKNLPSNARNQVGIVERCSHTEEERYKNDQIKQFPKQKKLEKKELRERQSPQIVEEHVQNKESGRESCHTLGQWLHKETSNWDVLYKPVLPSNLITMKKEFQEAGLSRQISIPRKSFSHIKRSSVGDESSMPNSPVFPSYMDMTESSKAKARCMSTPRQRTGFLDICSNQNENDGIYFCSSNYGATSTTNENSEVSPKRYQSAKNHYYH